MNQKIVGVLTAVSAMFIAAGTGYAAADAHGCPNALFTAKSCETQRISIGGFISTVYQWVDLRIHTTSPPTPTFVTVTAPEEFNNFYMKNIRLFVRANLCDNWTAFMSIDFAGRDGISYQWNRNAGAEGANVIDSSFQCRDQSPIFVDRAYIEKKWSNATFRAGYQKVSFGAEQLISDQYLKTINRSVATNFFMSLGQRAVRGQDLPPTRLTEFGGNRFADRHIGLYLSGDACDDKFHYNFAVVNGFQGLCLNSTQFNNELGYFAGLNFESSYCEVAFSIGINAGYQPKGGDWTTDLCPPNNTDDYHVWGLNPYILANWNCFSILAEMLYGSVQNAQLTNFRADANPWGFNLIPSYIINDCWELVARLSYLNTNKMGTSVVNASGATPDQARISTPNIPCGFPAFVSSEGQSDKVTSGYIGINYYTVNQAVKASLGYEYSKFKNGFSGPISRPDNTGPTGSFFPSNLIVQSVRAQLQLMF